MDDHLKIGATNAAPPTFGTVPDPYVDGATPSGAGGGATSVAPAVRPVRWSGKKTAVAAALAVGLATVGGGAVAAAAPTVTSQLGDRGGHGPGGPGGFGGPGGPGGPMGQQGQAGQLPPGMSGQAGQQGQPPAMSGQQGQPPAVPGQQTDPQGNGS